MKSAFRLGVLAVALAIAAPGVAASSDMAFQSGSWGIWRTIDAKGVGACSVVYLANRQVTLALHPDNGMVYIAVPIAGAFSAVVVQANGALPRSRPPTQLEKDQQALAITDPDLSQLMAGKTLFYTIEPKYVSGAPVGRFVIEMNGEGLASAVSSVKTVCSAKNPPPQKPAQ